MPSLGLGICDYIDVIRLWCSIWNWHFSIWHFYFLSSHLACGISHFTLHTSYSTLTFHVSDIVVVSELNSNCLFFFLKPAVPSRATLIISPAPIAQQWVDEIFRHTEPSSIKLLVRNNSMVGLVRLFCLGKIDLFYAILTQFFRCMKEWQNLDLFYLKFLLIMMWFWQLIPHWDQIFIT